MLVTLLGIVMLVSARLCKAQVPMLVRVLGIVIFASFLQLANTQSARAVMPFPRTTVSRFAHDENAFVPMVVTLSGIITFFNLLQLSPVQYRTHSLTI